MYIITYKNRILNKPKETYWCLLQVCSRYGKYQVLLCCNRSALFIKPGKKKREKFAVQVCGSEKSFAVAEVQKITANVPQTCGFAVADHLLLFCGICGCGIEFKFAVPSTGYISVNTDVDKNTLAVLEHTFTVFLMAMFIISDLDIIFLFFSIFSFLYFACKTQRIQSLSECRYQNGLVPVWIGGWHVGDPPKWDLQIFKILTPKDEFGPPTGQISPR